MAPLVKPEITPAIFPNCSIRLGAQLLRPPTTNPNPKKIHPISRVSEGRETASRGHGSVRVCRPGRSRTPPVVCDGPSRHCPIARLGLTARAGPKKAGLGLIVLTSKE